MSMVQQVPQVGRCPGPGKRRGRGDGMGAEDGEVWPAMVSVHAVNRGGVAQDTVRRAWVCGRERRVGARWTRRALAQHLPFAACVLLRRYEAIHPLENVCYACWGRGG